MFSLIITIVSIALVVALVAATMYHGGDTLTQGRTKADAAAFVTGAQQVSGAAVMFSALEGTAVADVAGLVTGGYLSNAPSVAGEPLALTVEDIKDVDDAKIGETRLVTAIVASDAVCEAINISAGAETPAAVTDLAGLAYGCVQDAGGNQFKFKY